MVFWNKTPRFLRNAAKTQAFCWNPPYVHTPKKTYLTKLFLGQGWIPPLPASGSPSAGNRSKFASKFCPRIRPMSTHQKEQCDNALLFLVVGRGGFGPPKSVTADLQSAPFGRSGTYPYIIYCYDFTFLTLELAIGIEPTTC